MGNRRQLYKHHLNCLILLCALAGAAAFADNSGKDLNHMTEFSSRDAQLEAALKLSKLVPSAALGRPLIFDQDRFKALIGDDVLITSFKNFREGRDLVVNAYSKKNDVLAVRLEISQITDRNRVADRLAGSFDLISAPLDGVELVLEAGADLVARFSISDTYAVASRGDILVIARTGDGYRASGFAAMVLNEIFAAK